MGEHNDQHRDPVDVLLGGLDSVLDVVHDRVIRPLLIATRFLAFGFLLFTLSVVILVAGIIGVIRFGNVFIFQGYVWLNYLVVGSLTTFIGLLIWRRRRPVSVRKK
jgi:hypothetical protein